jgi:hypothetical protein
MDRKLESFCQQRSHHQLESALPVTPLDRERLGRFKEDHDGVVAAGGDDISARVAGPQLGAGCLLKCRQSTRVVGVRVRIQEHRDVPDVEAERRDARHNHRRGAGITAVEHDVARGPGDEEGRDVVGADLVEIAGDAERFGGQLPAAGARVPPLAEEYQRKSAQHSEQEDQHASPGEVPQRSPSRFAKV